MTRGFILVIADVEKLSHRRNILYFDLCPQSGVLRGLYKNIDCSSRELATMIWQLEILHFATMSWPPYAKSQQTAWCPAGLDCGARLQLTRASPGPGRRHLFGKRPDLTLLCSTSHSTSARNNKLQSLLVSWFTIDVLVFVFIFVFVFFLEETTCLGPTLMSHWSHVHHLNISKKEFCIFQLTWHY